MKIITKANNKVYMSLILFFCSLPFAPIYGYGLAESPAAVYYEQQIKQDMPDNAPSDSYYNAELRAGWDEDDGPGGSGEGDNSGVGVPLDDGTYAIIFAVMIYTSVRLLRKRKVNNPHI